MCVAKHNSDSEMIIKNYKHNYLTYKGNVDNSLEQLHQYA